MGTEKMQRSGKERDKAGMGNRPAETGSEQEPREKGGDGKRDEHSHREMVGERHGRE